MHWVVNERSDGYNLYSSRHYWLATFYYSSKYVPTLRIIPEYGWTFFSSKGNMERIKEELGFDANTNVDEMKLKIETLYRLHGYD